MRSSPEVRLARVVLLSGLVFCALLWPGLGRAQPEGYYLTPSLTLSGVFDDNIFLTSAHREADFITRLTPGISVGYRSFPLTILGNYAFDGEKYAANHDLDNVADRQRGSLEMRYVSDRQLTLGLTAAYAKTNRPVELSQQTGLQPIARVERGLEETTAFTASPSVTYRFTALTSGNAAYSYSLLEASRGGSTMQHVVSLELTQRFTGDDTGSLRYVGRRFEFADDTSATETSHTILVGWIRRLTAFTTMTVQAGPRVTADGKADVEALASLEHRLKFANLLLSYSRTPAVAVAQSGTVVTDTLTGQATIRPHQFLQLSVGSSVQRAASEAGSRSFADTYYYSAGAAATYQMNKWLNARAAYVWSRQEAGGQQILHNVLSISLTATYPIRLGY